MTKDRIYLSSPHMCGEEMKYINEAFATNWIAPLGKNVEMFEKEMCEHIGCNSAVALASGSSAIHLGLKYLGVQKDDIVFCSSFTFSGSCNAIDYCKAKPVFIDSEYNTYNMSPEALKKAYEKYPNPAALIIVDLYGNPANYDELCTIAKEHNTPILEDAAEGLGSKYHDKFLGNFGDIGIISFNGNKIITTSGGGMALVPDKKAHDKILFWATQSREPFPWYQHEEIGYNYRLSNICAGIGRGQLTVLDLRVEQKRHIYKLYTELFKDCKYINMIPDPENCHSNHWLSVITFSKDCKTTFMDVINILAENNIESRPAWKPMHMQPVWKDCDFFSTFSDEEIQKVGFGSVCEDLFNRSVCLPSDSKMTDEQIKRVASIVLELVNKQNKLV